MRKAFYASAIALLGLAAVPVQAMTIAPLSGAAPGITLVAEGAAPVFIAGPTVVVFARAAVAPGARVPGLWLCWARRRFRPAGLVLL